MANIHSTEENTGGSFRFRKAERLRHKSLVDGLYSDGKSIYDFPLRLTWKRVTTDELSRLFRNDLPPRLGKLQMMVTVPKKKRRRAVDRVLMRRRIREAYRLNRLPLSQLIAEDTEIGSLSIGFIYLDTQNADYALIERKMINLIQKLIKKLGSDPSEKDSVSSLSGPTDTQIDNHREDI